MRAMPALYTVDVPLVSGTKKIAFTMNALAAAEKELGRGVLALLAGDSHIEVAKRLGFLEVRTLLWAGLRAVRQRGGPDWSLERVGDELLVEHFNTYVRAIIQALNLALAGSKEPAPEEQQDPTTEAAPQSSTGTASS